MQKIISILIMCFGISMLYAQETPAWCAKKTRIHAKKKVDSTILAQRLKTLNVTATRPYLIKLFVVIFSSDDGSAATVSHEDVKRQIANMRDYFAPHDICFALAAIQNVNNSALYSINVIDEEVLLTPYIRDGYITIFVHNSVFNPGQPGIAGSAYDIPNNYLSVEGPVLADSDKILLAHEMGHCFGLLHTFEDFEGEENVARSGGCKDCEDDGDYLCDTPADRIVASSFIDDNCNYTGSRRDDCGSILIMATDNLMSYHRVSCITRFTAGQGNRCRNHIVSESILSDALAGDNFNIFFPSVSTSDYKIYVARNTVTFGANGWLSTGSAKVSATANAIVVKAGTQFQPTANAGYAVLRVNPFCQ